MKIAVIGVGNMGKHHARVYTELPKAHLVAIADPDAKVGREVAQRYGCKFHLNYHDLLDSERIDAASIAVPTSLHRDVAVACLEKRIPILIEKPIADSIKSANEIIRMGKKKGVPVCIGHIERFNPVIRKLKKLIRAERFGKIISIWTKRVGLFPSQIKDADVIIDIAVHDIDICNYLTECSPRTVYATAGKALNSKRLDYAGIFLKYDGVDAVLQVNWITPIKVRELTITGTEGYAELNYLNQSLRIFKSNYERIFDSYGDYIVKFGTPHDEEIHVRMQEPLKLEIQNFLQVVTGKKGDVVSADEGMKALHVCLESIDAFRTSKVKEITYDL